MGMMQSRGGEPVEEFTDAAVMKRMGCAKEHAVFLDCFNKAKKNNEEDPYTKCMEAASPVLDCIGNRKDELMRSLDAAEKLLEQKAEALLPKFQGHELDGDQIVARGVELLKEGPCKESLTDMFACVEEAEKNKEDELIKCKQVLWKANDCIQAHLDYYRPLLVAGKSVQQRWFIYDAPKPDESPSE